MSILNGYLQIWLLMRLSKNYNFAFYRIHKKQQICQKQRQLWQICCFLWDEILVVSNDVISLMGIFLFDFSPILKIDLMNYNVK